ncbi:hypothetical protein GPN2_21002 [Streptomyces murinus]
MMEISRSCVTGSASSVAAIRSRSRPMAASRVETISSTTSVSRSQPSLVPGSAKVAAIVSGRPSGETPSAAARSATVSEWARAVATTSSSWRWIERNRGPTMFQCACFPTSDRPSRSTRVSWSAGAVAPRAFSDSVLFTTVMVPTSPFISVVRLAQATYDLVRKGGCPAFRGANSPAQRAGVGSRRLGSAGQRPVQEPRHLRERLLLHRLVEHLVPRPGEDPLGEIAAGETVAGEPLDTGAAAGQRHQPVVVPVQPQHRQPGHGTARGDGVQGPRERLEGGPLHRPVPDQRIGGVRGAHRRIAGERARTDRRVRDLRQRQQPPRQLPGADHRPGEDQRGQFRAVQLRVAGRDQPAHGVADQDQRQPRMRGAGEIGHGTHIGDHVLEVLDQHPLTGRAPVPHMVGRVHGGPVPGEDGGQPVVPARVLAVPVHQQGEEAGRGMLPLADGEFAAGAVDDVRANVGHLSSNCLGTVREDLPRGAFLGL